MGMGNPTPHGSTNIYAPTTGKTTNHRYLNK